MEKKVETERAEIEEGRNKTPILSPMVSKTHPRHQNQCDREAIPSRVVVPGSCKRPPYSCRRAEMV